MAEIVTIARPYAEAVFRLAQQQGQLRAWSDVLALAGAVAQDARMQAIIADPNVTAAQVENLFLSVCGERLDAAGKNFIKVLAQNGRLEVLPAIAELYEQLKAREEGVLEARIFSALPLSEPQVKQLVGMLETRFRRKVGAQVSVEPELIGGVRVEIGDQVLDASVRGRLQAMAFALAG